MYLIPIVIPSYEPNDNFIDLLEKMVGADLGPIIVVNDGSGKEYEHYFVKAGKIISKSGGAVITHDINRGKGRALKTAFDYVLKNYPDAVGCITADSDGQHNIKSIQKCKQALQDNPEHFVLGVRNFEGDDIPPKSKFGNKMTRKICKFLCGISVSDTQTGLRGIPVSFMRKLLDLEGERFEFETRMLIVSKGKYEIEEVVIDTVYDSRDNHSTHFQPIKDSIRIYRIFAQIFLKFIFSSLSSSVLDLVLFKFFCTILKKAIKSIFYVAISTVLARIISAAYNYCINYKLVFKSKENHMNSLTKYIGLAIVQMLCSAATVTELLMVFPNVPEILIKIPVDVMLFFASYYIQKNFVFNTK